MSNIPLLLKKTDKVLFIIHLAIGDFAYLQSTFKVFKKHYPGLKVDLFVVESRCTEDQSKWPYLEKDVIYDWLEGCGLFNKIYRKNYAPHLFAEAIEEAKKENYPLIISFGDVHSEPTERYAREMAGADSIVAGLKLHINWYRLKYQIYKRKLWKNLDITFRSIPMKKGRHISDLFAFWFEQIGGYKMTPEEKLPFIEIPQYWQEQATQKLAQLKNTPSQQVIFINYLAKDPNRSWKLEQAIELIEKMQQLPKYTDALYFLNTTPDHLSEISGAIQTANLANTIPFSATDNFYELPAILEQSDLIISVETSIIHLANAVNTPLIALMRHKTPEWEPPKKEITEVIWCHKKRDKIVNISPDDVIERIKAYS
ncbi:glycosyltransferase family 9 protein [Ignatzschineria indica]|uniref:glycosyltransferase family 9 protein n=1 Tax=Ignatzschineria indica TaxID=472583 RepID=UPI002577F12A|nr:glycosyltransferase family 9 protein [Ignatzschineria indica]MDM1545278.1 glycosyltransferase family 9 protein [Ignatzschineria indica]